MSEKLSIAETHRQRDKRLRRRILVALQGATVNDGGGLTAPTLMEFVDSMSPSAEQLEDDYHVLRLCRDLVSAGLAKETDLRTKKTQWQRLDTLHYAITTSGTALVEQLVPANPLVEDDRR